MSKARELGVVVYGATGYTGRLVAEYFNRQYGVNGDVKWAMAGRSQAKLEAVRDELGIDSSVPLIVADAADPASIASMVERCNVVLTTVGPYQLYGSELVAAAAIVALKLASVPPDQVPFIERTRPLILETGAPNFFSAICCRW